MNSTSAVPASITQAISLLTTPLLLKQSTKTIATLRAVLQANLVAPLPTSGQFDLHFKLSPFSLPPAPILAACIASGVTWAEWSRALGGQAFDIYISTTAVSIKLAVHERPLTFWRQPAPSMPSAMDLDESAFVPPISRIQHREVGIVAKRLLIRPPSVRAPAIRIPQLPIQRPAAPSSKLSRSFSPFDDEESDSSDSESSPDSSRPSSRLSTFSFESLSDDGSFTSVSSVSSPEDVTPPKKSFLNPMTKPFTPKASTPVIDRSHKATTAYLYEGGSTRVMTGGVMLGKAATNNLKSKPAPVAVSFGQSKGSASKSWRRL